MRTGTKSLLFGVHQFLVHPWFVAWAWHRLYGFPRDPRLWVAFFIHDLGYWGCRNMDDDEGERHAEWGARLMSRLFDKRGASLDEADRWRYSKTMGEALGPWGWFTLHHSRFYSKRDGYLPSRLCVADKLANVLMPKWMYLPLASASGEVREYMAMASSAGTKYTDMSIGAPTKSEWYDNLVAFLSEWVEANRDNVFKEGVAPCLRTRQTSS